MSDTEVKSNMMEECSRDNKTKKLLVKATKKNISRPKKKVTKTKVKESKAKTTAKPRASEKPTAKPKRSRTWTWTLNNYTNDDVERLMNKSEDDIKYLTFGKEIAPTTGTPHLQGYVMFNNARSFNSAKAYISTRCWIAASKGTAIQNHVYTCKDDDVFTIGTLPQQGKRNDLNKVREMVKDGDSMEKILENTDSYQGARYAELCKKYISKKRDWKTKVLWFWGKTGTFKSRTAFDLLKEDVWVSGETLKWWDGYDGQKNVIIDDFRADNAKFHTMLRILDRYPYQVEIKGASRQLLAENIIITCPYHPKDVYKNRTDEDINQFLRRIECIKYFPTGSNYEKPECDTDDYILAHNTKVKVQENNQSLDYSQRKLFEESRKRVVTNDNTEVKGNIRALTPVPNTRTPTATEHLTIIEEDSSSDMYDMDDGESIPITYY